MSVALLGMHLQIVRGSYRICKLKLAVLIDPQVRLELIVGQMIKTTRWVRVRRTLVKYISEELLKKSHHQPLA